MARYFTRTFDGKITEVFDARLWRLWAVDSAEDLCKIASDKITAPHPKTGQVMTFDVLTSFLGVDAAGSADPLLFETAIYGHQGNSSEYTGEFQYRYRTEEEARKGHAIALNLLQRRELPGRLMLTAGDGGKSDDAVE